MATWSKDVNAWLPQTEFIVFVDATAQTPSAMIPWELALQHVSELLVPVPDVVPVRYQVCEFPDVKSLEKMSEAVAS